MTTTTRQLYRSRTNRMIAGIGGGLAEYFDLDPTLMRLILLALAFAGGAGLLAYLVAWIIMPEAPLTNTKEAPMTEPTSDQPVAEAAPAEPHHHPHHHAPNPQGRMIGGVILIVIGGLFLVQQTIGFNVWRYSWPLLLIAIGLIIIIKRA